jgi:hypothetical protein
MNEAKINELIAVSKKIDEASFDVNRSKTLRDEATSSSLQNFQSVLRVYANRFFSSFSRSAKQRTMLEGTH